MTDAEIAALRAEAETFAAEPTGKSTFTALEMARDLVRSLLSTLTAQAEALAEARRERDEARAVALEACDLAETMFTNWSGTDGARVDRNLGSDAESEAMDEIERLRTALTAGGKP